MLGVRKGENIEIKKQAELILTSTISRPDRGAKAREVNSSKLEKSPNQWQK